MMGSSGAVRRACLGSRCLRAARDMGLKHHYQRLPPESIAETEAALCPCSDEIMAQALIF
jgi:hypothetical protein